ncbi:TPA: hypothetical protein QDA74_003723 [Burkholderia territorii]|uniref:KAP family P-loop NTPase fold protein n=1 Tax=Burkholderia territorii TaxID=1503055 RepID=UPI0011CC5285|nr:P-loop NTPase fold protein [Burkholderia territorii]TXG07056.1 hypothetical protein FU139_25430 [Burkholderia territorii]HDR8859225.1 hypothetical protein [Burkholderia territorii]HDR8866210.1 hypothetical protein [Burkholderia territorii]HDR8872314.1 hypothetical protein [Burkholderia territorii]HDR8878212.1 hypothetical protein [Burkholderia territorii]
MNDSTTDQPQIPPLTLSPAFFEKGSSPFTGDLLGRGELARKLSDFMPRLRNGAVVAIDAEWGGGKTWFGTHWAAQLDADGHKVAFINAFEQDYTEDPFIPIAAKLSELLDSADGKGKTLLKRAAEVASACLPVGAKIAASAAAKWMLGEIDVSKEYADAVQKAEEKSEEFVKQWVERKLENHKKEHESLQAFRKALQHMATAEAKPVVIFIDELDRCRPDFAVRLIERIKHFFETPNVVFVLLIHREQLNRAIQGVYGTATDGAAYLAKFVHFFFKLPSNQTASYIPLVLRRLNVDERRNSVSEFMGLFELWQSFANLTMRDIERGCALFSYAEHQRAEGLLAYFITVKLKRPDLFDGMLAKRTRAFEQSKEWIDQLQRNHPNDELVDRYHEYLLHLRLLHSLYLGTENPTTTAGQRFNMRHLGSRIHYNSPPDTFDFYLRQIDLPID